MKCGSQRAFTMIELIFVVVVIGILAAVALPRFSGTAEMAYDTKAQDTLASVRSSLATERQKRILQGDDTNITSLHASSNNDNSTNVFDHFSADGNGKRRPVLNYPVKPCPSGRSKGCWKLNGTKYEYHFVNGNTASFKLENNRLVCADTVTTNCQKIE